MNTGSVQTLGQKLSTLRRQWLCLVRHSLRVGTGVLVHTGRSAFLKWEMWIQDRIPLSLAAQGFTIKLPGKDLSSEVVKTSQGDVSSSIQSLQVGSHEERGHSACHCTHTVVLTGGFYWQLNKFLPICKNSPFYNQRAQGGLPIMILKGGKFMFPLDSGEL